LVKIKVWHGDLVSTKRANLSDEKKIHLSGIFPWNYNVAKNILID